MCLNGSLLAVAGWNRDGSTSLAVHVFLNSEWVRLEKADLPAARMSCGTAQLLSDEVIVIGGMTDTRLCDVYIGTLQ